MKHGKPQVEKQLVDYAKFFASRTSYARQSDIRELLKIINMPGMISFAGGIPCAEAFPLDDINQIMQSMLKNHGVAPLQYSETEGIIELREALVNYVKAIGIDTNVNEVQITAGAQQGLFLCSYVLIDAGDTVISENPIYLGKRQVLEPMRANIIGIHVDKEGIKLDYLEDELKQIRKRGESVKYIYVVPTFQNPTGVTIPEKNRKRLIDIVNEYDTLLIEDDPYYFLRYEGENIPPIKSFDDEGRVVYLMSFSKTIAPGLRTGAIIANPRLREKFTIAKQALDLCSPALTQYFVYDLLSNKSFLQTQIERIRRIYTEKKNTMLSTMQEYFPSEVKWTKPQGGLFAWVTTPQYINMRTMLSEAIAEKVAYVPGDAFEVNSAPNCARLSFSLPSKEDIRLGVNKLGDLLKNKIRKVA